MVDKYNADLLRVAVAQVCQTIGYNNSQTAPLELLQDVLRRFMIEISRELHGKTEHANRTIPTLRDLYLSMSNMNLNIGEILEYVNNVEPIPFALEIPKFPAKKQSNLNFLKPGSKEVLTRPVHVNEYLPPLLEPEVGNVVNSQGNNIAMLETDGASEFSLETVGEVTVANEPSSVEQCQAPLTVKDENKNSLNWPMNMETPCLKSLQYKDCDDKRAPTREISSVVMTSGGFISPATEGKLPDAIIPDIIDKLQGLDAPPPPKPVAPPTLCTTSDKNVSNAVIPQTKSIDTASGTADKLPNKKPNIPKSSENIELEVKSEPNNSNIQTTSQKPFFAASPTKPLKKGKKKQSNMTCEGSTSEMSAASSGFLSKSQEKAQRKAMKILQKLNKSINSESAGIAEISDKNLKMQMTPAFLASLPSDSPQRLQLEKLLKKKAKHRQKMLKEQMAQELFAKQQMLLAEKDNSLINCKNIVDPQSLNRIEGSAQYLPTRKEDSERIPLELAPEMNQLTKNVNNQPDLVNKMENVHKDFLTAGPELMLQTNAIKEQNEIKLSTEPDRSKLNIIKRISKQKNLKALSPNLPNNSLQLASVCGSMNDVQSVINLPSGTTITPAPAEPLNLATDSIYKPISSSFNDSNIKTNIGGLAGINTPASTSTVIYGTPTTETLTPVDPNKPKKRGRKPGSKNQVKTGLPTTVQSKKTKTNKFDKLIYGPNMEFNNLSGMMPSGMEPLNLNKSPVAASLNLNANFQQQQQGTNINHMLNLLKTPQESPLKGERKERKKYKTKTNVLGLTPTNMDATATSQHFLPSSMECVGGGESKFGLLPSPTKMNLAKASCNTTPKQKQQQQLQASSELSPNMAAAHHAFMNPLTAAFQNKQPNMLPMLSLLSFPPRPGLIPTGPGLFPTAGLGSFGNNSAASAASNLLMPPFLPFPTLNPAAGSSGSLTLPTDKSNKHADVTIERNLLNAVPAFGLDSMKLNMPPTEGTSEAKTSAMSNDVLENSASKNKFMSNPMVALSTLYGFGSMSTKPPVASGAGTIDEPIEVSDDSNETNQPVVNKAQPENLSMSMDNFFVASMHAEAKKLKKINKSLTKRKQIDDHRTTTTANTLNLNFMNNEKLSLAGGADLIPLSRVDTGLAYSLHTIPSNSLTAATATSSSSAAPAPLTMSVLPALTQHSPAEAEQLFKTSFINNSSSSVYDGVTITPANSSAASALEMKKRKEHKKLKKIKEGKIKKKKDKKDKSKNKERLDEKQFYKHEKQFTKEMDKKMKKDKKREKQRLMMRSSSEMEPIMNVLTVNTSTLDSGQNPQPASSGPQDLKNDSTTITMNPISAAGILPAVAGILSPKAALSTLSPNQVPKLTLKLGGNSKTNTPLPFDDIHQHNEKSQMTQVNEPTPPPPRAQSPELARFSPLVTRPPKQKQLENTSIGSITMGQTNASGISATNIMGSSESLVNPLLPATNSSWLQGGTLSASSVLLPQQLLQTSINATANAIGSNNQSGNAHLKTEKSQPSLPQVPETNRPSSYVDAEGNRIWICPACGKVDDGSPMIGCDGCDAWYHWVCVGILVAPKDNEDWFCRVCLTKKKVHGEKKRKRNKKK